MAENPPTRDGTVAYICIPISPPGCQHCCLIQTSDPASTPPLHFCSTGTRWWGSEEEARTSMKSAQLSWLPSHLPWVNGWHLQAKCFGRLTFRPQLSQDICLAQGDVMSGQEQTLGPANGSVPGRGIVTGGGFAQM